MNPEPESSGNVIGEIIRRQRELAELSMRQVAAMAGISNPYLSQIEHGLRAPSADVLETIATTLGIPPLPCVRTRVMIMRQQLTLITKGTGHPVTMPHSSPPSPQTPASQHGSVAPLLRSIPR